MLKLCKTLDYSTSIGIGCFYTANALPYSWDFGGVAVRALAFHLSKNVLNVTQTQCSTHVKRVSQHTAESRGFSPAPRLTAPTRKLVWWVRTITDREVKSQLL